MNDGKENQLGKVVVCSFLTKLKNDGDQMKRPNPLPTEERIERGRKRTKERKDNLRHSY